MKKIFRFINTKWPKTPGCVIFVFSKLSFLKKIIKKNRQGRRPFFIVFFEEKKDLEILRKKCKN